MKIRIAPIIALAFLLLSCATIDNEPLEKESIPNVVFTNSFSDIRSPVNGNVIQVEKTDSGGFNVAIETSISYWYQDSEREERIGYNLFIFNLSEVEVFEGEIRYGDVIGISSDSTWLSACAEKIDPALIRYTKNEPQKVNDVWWYSPDWIISTTFKPFSYRPVPSLEYAAEDFFQRWAREGCEARGYTIHHFPDLDRIRVKTTMDSYPELQDVNGAVTLTESTYYHCTGVFVSKSIVLREGYDVALWWQKDFDKWLREEYKLGEEVWLYCTFFTLDHENQELVVFVRDFVFEDQIEVAKDRIKNLIQ